MVISILFIVHFLFYNNYLDVYSDQIISLIPRYTI